VEEKKKDDEYVQVSDLLLSKQKTKKNKGEIKANQSWGLRWAAKKKSIGSIDNLNT